MADRVIPSDSYDRIAHLYDVDMARNMPFDDVRLYATVASATDGRTLELGCGNGRILLELCARGVDAVGIDGSVRMLDALRAKAAARGLAVPACRMDARALGFGASFALVLCPYSMITYMADERDATRMLAEIARVLTPAAHVVVDAFIPRDDAHDDAFRIDYRRPYDAGTLVRSKRITRIAPRIHRIERRYEIVDAEARLMERIETCEDIRVFSPDQLRGLLAECGFAVERCWWDYACGERSPETRFVTMLASRIRR